MDETEPRSRENGAAQRLLRPAATEIVSACQRMPDLPAVRHYCRIPAPAPQAARRHPRANRSRRGRWSYPPCRDEPTVETNLLTIITTLEADQHDCRCTSADSETCCGKESSDAP